MTNKEIYQKTLTFSLGRFLIDLISIVILAGLSVGGFFLAERLTDQGLIGLAVGLILGIVIVALIARFISYRYKAAQIAMMTKGVSEGSLPENVREEGFRLVRENFATVAVYFAVTRAIKGVFQQLGRLITGAAERIGGDNGNAVGGAISTVINTIVAYLCDCCLGWIFYRGGQHPFKAACEGAVIFFRHGKTFLKNMGRVFGMGLVSLLGIGGVFSGVFYLIFTRFPAWFQTVSAKLAALEFKNQTVMNIISDPATLTIAAAVIGGIIIWSILHSVLVKPFVLVGVLRNYIASGQNDTVPASATFAELAGKSKKFAELQAKANAEG